MGAMDKFLNFMKLNEDNADYDEDDDDYYNDVMIEEKPRKVVSKNTDEEVYGKSKPVAKVTPIRQTKKNTTTNGMEVCVIKPNSIEDAREITETLLANRTVVLNMEGIHVDLAQRIIDFTSGSCFAINGNLQKISHYIFIITPETVDISGDFQDILAGNFDVPPINNTFNL